MPFKIAAGSSDGKVINQHFGSCRQFLIINVDSDNQSYSFDGFRTVTPPCNGGEHEGAALEKAAEALSDCRAVLISKIGPPAAAVITRYGIDVMEYHGLIEDAVKRILQYYH